MSRSITNDPVSQLLREGCHRRIFPGAVVCASRKGTVRYYQAAGSSTLLPQPLPMVAQALFDVASLTKPVATTTALMLLVDAGEIELEQSASRVFPLLKKTGKQAITLRHLLNHCSGLPAHIRYYEQLEALRQEGRAPQKGTAAVDWVIEQIAQLDTPPPQQKAVYSDLDFILLGRIVELVAQQPFHLFCQEEIFTPLGMQDTFFLPLHEPAKRTALLKGRQVVATLQCPWRQRLLVGEVHDDNCHAMGGVAGHAGLFSTAADIHRFALAMLRCYHEESSFLPTRLVREFWRVQNRVPGSTWTLGWDSPSPGGTSQAGRFFPPPSVGHLAYTGCSLWLNVSEQIVVVFLSNRIHPHDDNVEIKRFRPILQNAIYGLITSPSPLPPPPAHHLGNAPTRIFLERRPPELDEAPAPGTDPPKLTRPTRKDTIPADRYPTPPPSPTPTPTPNSDKLSPPAPTKKD